MDKRRLHEMGTKERIAWADEQAVMALEEELRRPIPMRLWLLWLRLLRALDRLVFAARDKREVK